MNGTKPLITQQSIQKRIATLAKEITGEADSNAHFICILNSAAVFYADLIRQLPADVPTGFIRVRSYAGTKQGELSMLLDFDTDVKGKVVYLIEDIIDSGKTINLVIERLKQFQPKEIRIIALLTRKSTNLTHLPPTHIGFTIDDEFVVGYGMDYNNKYRGLVEIYDYRKM